MTTTDRSQRPDPAVLERPRRAEGVEVSPPSGDGAPWVVSRDGSYLRVGADLARLIERLDGRSGPGELAEQLGPRWSAETVRAAVGKLHTAGLIADGARRSRPAGRRVKFVPPLTLQLTLVRPGRGLAAVARATRALAGRPGLAVLLAVAAAGLLALLAPPAGTVAVLSNPLPWQAYLAVLVAGAVATTLHEVGHGIALLHQGGRPSRLGVMLFYLVPAMFCDVSDAWRLPRPRQRVVVALAGVLVQAVLGGVAALAATVLPLSDALHAGLVVFAILSYGAGVLNLLPFVKLDGYIALMSHLDHPNLRADAVADARDAASQALFGGRRRERRLPDWSWAVPYGLACLAFPVLLVLVVLGAYSDMLARAGIVGAVLLAGVAVYLGYLAVRGAVRLARNARRHGARWARIGAVGAAAAAVAGAALVTVPVPYTVAGGYVEDGGTGYFVVMEGTQMSETPSVGDEVRMYQSGILLSRPQGTGRVAGTDPRVVDAPVEAFVPLDAAEDAVLPATAWPLDQPGTVADPPRTAVLNLGDRPLGEWLYLTYLAPVLR